MSAMKRGFSPSVPAGTDSRKSYTNNGSGPPPLKYSNAPVDDVNMNEVIEEQLELTVYAPGGKSSQITVDSNIPMQDLRILLAAKNKVSPTGYSLLVFGEENNKPLDYKANQTIGSLEGRIVQLVSKHKEKEVDKSRHIKPLPATKSAQPFEVTHRFTINLPRNQKMLMRISPEMNLGQLFTQVCGQKHLDPRRYALQHPTNPQMNITMSDRVADLKANEINLIPLGLVADSARSMPDLSRSESLTLPKDSMPTYMPGASEPKKKRTFLSFLKRKDNKFRVQDTKYNNLETSSTASNQIPAEPPRQSLTPPPEQPEPEQVPQSRPKSMFVTAKELKAQEESLTLPRPATRKKRPAPPPPQAQKSVPETVEISVKDKATVQVEKKVKEENVAKSTPDHVTQRLHSRNSSDSSGYHELTLSGAESPEASRVSTNFKTSIDTTSIESADNTNGDSPVPLHSSPKREMTAGDSKTLPLPKVSKHSLQRSHSLEKKEKEKLPPPSSKKRRAPAPPGAGGPPVPDPTPSAPSHTPDTPQDLTHDTSLPQPSQNAPEETSSNVDQFKLDPEDVVLHGADEDDVDSVDLHDTLDGLMMMVEDASIASEDLDNIEQPKAQRPCAFVPPPPPDEPPPPQTPETETVDVGVEVHDNSSLGGPPSVKNSPVSAHSRQLSQTSISSVNTIEDLNMDFEQTIAMAEEALESEKPAEAGYKTEMAMFVERMSKLTEKADSETNMSDTTSISLGDTESETGSVIRHENERIHLHPKMDSLSSDSGSIQKYSSEDRSRDGSMDATNETDILASRVRRDSLEMQRNGKAADNQVSEIDVPVDMLPPPPEFQNKPANQEEEEEEEEYRESTEEIIVTFPASSSFTFGGSYRIPDYETPKEHSSLPDSPRSRSSDTPMVYSTFEINESEEPHRSVQHKPPRVKEEYVLTKEDRAKLKFVDNHALRGTFIPPAKKPVFSDLGTSDSDAHVSYASFQPSAETDLSLEQDDVKSRCNELSFRPDSEQEDESFLEEKSISMIALPAMRTSVLKKSDDEYLDTIKQEQSTALVADREMRSKFFEDEAEETVQAKPVYIIESADNAQSDAATDDEDIKKQQASLHAQYDMLQKQFSMWQTQLDQNQKLLASQNLDPEVQSIQQMQVQQMQLQMQMQQQMMAQLQKSMDALSLQQKSRTDSTSSLSSRSDATSVKSSITEPSISSSVIAASSRPSGGTDIPTPTSSGGTSVPVAPPPPPAVQASNQKSRGGRKNRDDDPRFKRQLDPREELMIAIRAFGDKGGLRKVPIQQTNWQGGS